MTKLPRNVKPHKLIRAFERIGFSTEVSQEELKDLK